MHKQLLTLILLFTIIQITAQAELTTSGLFSDGVVLQQKSKATIWGWAQPGTTVTVKGSWGESANSIVNAKGKWISKVKTPKAGGPYKIKISDGNSNINIEDVLIGEVWICSGQSNMDMPLNGWMPKDSILNYKEEIKNANYPKIRMFNVKKGHKIYPQKNVEGSWLVCNPENAGVFSAVSYFFGRELYQKLDVPIGLLHTSFGGSPAEAWLPKEDILDYPRFSNLEKEIKEVKANIDDYDNWVAGLKDPKFKGERNLFAFENTILCDEEYRKETYDDDNWKEIDLPANWSDINCDKYDGIVWYRKTFVLDTKHANTDLQLHLGKIDDVDETYLNGEHIGASYDDISRKESRVYKLSKELLKEGKNTIAIRVADVWGVAGFTSDEKPKITDNSNLVLELHQKWKYLPSAQYLNWKLQCFDENEFSYAKKPKLPFVVEQQAPTALYNAMILPIVPFKAKGFLWYQGESNTNNIDEYYTMFPRLINRWRKDWKDDSLPFYFAQIAPLKNYDNDKGKNTAELREAQFLTQKLHNTGMAVLLDLGDKWNIHPHRKQDVGRRLAYWALVKDYNTNITFSGPTYKSAEFNEGKAILSFDNVESGLLLKEGSKNIFQIAGKDDVFYSAQVEIVKNKLVVWSDKVQNPTKVTYAFTNWVEPTLYNKDGLPASSFRTN